MNATSTRADAFVVFGITGDLAAKMTFRALYRLEAAGRLNCPIIGLGHADWSHYRLVTAAREALAAGDQSVDPEVFERLARRLSYLRGDFSDPATYRELAERLENASAPVFYLAIPPALFGPVVTALGQAKLTNGASVLIEKPFGHDLDSARALNEELHRTLDEDQILRIDHFLAKQPVLDIAFLRFDNIMFEPVWNRDHIAAVQITMAEDFGVEDRGRFYDSVGALRDVVQNHLLQVLALLAMEAPAGPGSRALWDSKADVFRATADVDPAHTIAGQYEGYLDVTGVGRESVTETYVALRLEVNTPRWAGVPWFIRAGKALATRATEVRIVFHRPPPLTFLPRPQPVAANQLVLRIDPDPALRLILASQGATGTTEQAVHMDLPFAAELGQPPEPYERLLHDALTGAHSLFTREDVVEETWRILQPMIDHPPKPVSYPRGSWGPAGADELLRGHPGWQLPWLPDTGNTGT
ncbi:glucose-6-phosphate dehydrogenase [Nocardia sp. NBC_01327]|uniref:glucose-6-phosphate dehydrogenase n=1 Tax=Nocardia sp. NBC_01327 TaxID=2903593 RepID=UPI002E10EEC5|nr:glucose-6-phosphate dehydrogenase [Nocardia sp. NBC_01327]